MLETYKPDIGELGFRKGLMADPETMSYNAAWGGTIPFPQEDWQAWYEYWFDAPESMMYYRYLYDPELKAFVGEIAYHYDDERKIHICDVIVLAKYRNRGYGSAGLQLLYDDIAADNPSWKLFVKNGFEIDYRTDDVVMVKKDL